jgi:hypothetical protein
LIGISSIENKDENWGGEDKQSKLRCIYSFQQIVQTCPYQPGLYSYNKGAGPGIVKKLRQKCTKILKRAARIWYKCLEECPSFIKGGEVCNNPGAMINEAQVHVEPEVEIKKSKKD